MPGGGGGGGRRRGAEPGLGSWLPASAPSACLFPPCGLTWAEEGRLVMPPRAVGTLP